MRKRYAFFSSGLITVLIVLLCMCIPCVNVLSIHARKNPSQRFCHRVSGIQNFVISYTHSVNKGRVHDFYTWDKDGILTMDQTQFVSYGAGIPEPGETPGAVFVVTDEGYFIKNIKRSVARLTMGVGLIANHTIRFDTAQVCGQEIPFTRLFEPQTSVILEIKRVSLLEYIFHKF